MEKKYTGIVLEKKDLGETDRLYVFYTLEKGMMRAIGRGVRKPGAKLAGNLENFNLADIFVAKSKGIGNITGAIVEENFSASRNNLEALQNVFDSVKFFQRAVIDEDKDEKAFKLILDYLRAMDALSAKGGEDAKTGAVFLRQAFLFKLLDHLGYRINTQGCSACQGKNFSEQIYFSSEDGGMLCEKCLGTAKNPIRISRNFVKIIRIVYGNKIQSIPKLKVGEGEIRELEIILRNFFAWII